MSEVEHVHCEGCGGVVEGDHYRMCNTCAREALKGTAFERLLPALDSANDRVKVIPAKAGGE